MKKIIIFTIISIVLLPTLCMFSESDSFIPNIFGFIYSVVLYTFTTYTKIGRVIAHWVKINL